MGIVIGFVLIFLFLYFFSILEEKGEKILGATLIILSLFLLLKVFVLR